MSSGASYRLNLLIYGTKTNSSAWFFFILFEKHGLNRSKNSAISKKNISWTKHIDGVASLQRRTRRMRMMRRRMAGPSARTTWRTSVGWRRTRASQPGTWGAARGTQRMTRTKAVPTGPTISHSVRLKILHEAVLCIKNTLNLDPKFGPNWDPDIYAINFERNV